LIGLLGSLFFLAFTYPCYKILDRHVSFISISLIGSFFHNTGQLAASLLFLPSSSIFFFGLILYSIGIVTGFINGLITNYIYNKYKRYLYG
jgi:heptaprenyl diphosphate synthase